jgi:predicted MFS family arabinose efflux permease
MQGVGAALSGLASGLVVDRYGYNAAFALSGVMALAALAVLIFALPETGPEPEPKTISLGPVPS